MRQTALTQDFSVMDLFAGVQKLNEDYDVLPFGRETIGSPYSPTPSPQHQFFFLPCKREMDAFVFSSTVVFGRPGGLVVGGYLSSA